MKMRSNITTTTTTTTNSFYAPAVLLWLLTVFAMCLSQQAVTAQSTSSTDCYSNTTVLAQAIEAADPSQGIATYILCPDTTFGITSTLAVMQTTTTEDDNDMLPLLLRSNTTITCGPDGAATNNCVLSGGLSQIISLPRIFNDTIAENVVVAGVTLEASVETAALLGNAGDVSFVDCVFRDHTHAGVVDMVYRVSPALEEQPDYDAIVDDIVDIVNAFAPKRGAAVNQESSSGGGGSGNRDLSHITFQITLPEECTMVDFTHDFESTPARLVDLVQCTDFCGPGRYVNITVTSVCTTLDEEGCVNTADCIVAGCNEDCNVEAGECDCTDKFGQAEDGSLVVTGLCEEVCAAEAVDVATLAPTLSPTSAPVTVAVPATSSPTSAPVSVTTAAPTASPVAATVPGRQKVTFERCLFTSNSIISASDATTSDNDLLGLIVAGTAYNDVVIKDCEFSDMSYGTSTDVSAVAVIVQDGSTLDIQGTCFNNNDFKGAGVVVAVGSANVEAVNNFGTADDGLLCEFIALVASLDQPDASCVGYDLDECGGGQGEVTTAPATAPTAPTPTTAAPTTSPVIITPTTPSPDGAEEGGYPCSVCEPGQILSLPDKIVQIPPGFVEGITEASCALIDSTVRASPDQFDESTCSQLRAFYGAQCGCIAADEGEVTTAAPVTAPTAPTPTTAAPTASPVISTPTTPSPDGAEEGGYPCSVCEPGQILSLPDKIVQIPPGFVEGITEASCALIDGAVRANPDQFDESTCSQLRAFYGAQCGCIAADEGEVTTAPVTAPTAPTPTTAAPTASPVISTPTTPSPDGAEEGGYPCSVCEPGQIISLPDKIVQIPPGFVEGITEASCALIDTGVRGMPEAFTESTCSQLRAIYATQCGCIAADGEPTPAPVTKAPSSGTDGPEEGGYACSVCEPGEILSLPNKVVQIPPGFVEGITEAPCGLIDTTIRGMPDQFDESTCSQLRAFYGAQCGCIAGDGPTPAPVTRAPSSGTGCTICPEGEEITLPDAVIAIPEGFFSEGRTFATCELLQMGLDENPDLVGDDLCPSLREFYSIPCGCAPVDDGESDTSAGTCIRMRELLVKVCGCFLMVTVGLL